MCLPSARLTAWLLNGECKDLVRFLAEISGFAEAVCGQGGLPGTDGVRDGVREGRRWEEGREGGRLGKKGVN